jgi:hypothetical protein
MKKYSLIGVIAIGMLGFGTARTITTAQTSKEIMPPRVECPCNFGLGWAYTKKLGLDVDIHRESSCNNENNSTLQLNWTYLDRSEQQLRMKYPNYLRMDGIAYNHASVTYDDGSTRDGKETFQCRMEDMLILITADQARVCREQLEYACSRAQRSVCPCYSLSDLVLAEAQIFDDEIILDREMSCVRPLTREEGQYDYSKFVLKTMIRQAHGVTIEIHPFLYTL